MSFLPATCTPAPASWSIRSIPRKWVIRLRRSAGHCARSLSRGTSPRYSCLLFPAPQRRHAGNTARGGSNLDIIADALRTNPDYYALTNRDDLILDAAELSWLRNTLGSRIVVFDHGGHLGNLGSRQQVAALLDCSRAAGARGHDAHDRLGFTAGPMSERLRNSVVLDAHPAR